MCTLHPPVATRGYLIPVLLLIYVTLRRGYGINGGWFRRVDVVAVGTLPLHLPSGLVLVLNKCYFVPSLSVNIISGSCLLQDEYSFNLVSSGCAISMNDIFYVNAPKSNRLFLLNLDHSTNIHNMDDKRIKVSDDTAMYMWHCRLGHIGIKRMQILHSVGLLDSLYSGLHANHALWAK